MTTQLDDIRRSFEEQLAGTGTPEALDELRIRYLGRKGLVAGLMKTLPTLSADERPAFGRGCNELKKSVEAALDEKAASLSAGPRKKRVGVDVTVPGVPVRLGHRHVIQQTLAEMISIFQRLGFSVAYGPEVEDEWHNFDALNTPPEHPARDRRDNFYITDDVLLRTQTSPVQIRVMEKQKPPSVSSPPDASIDPTPSTPPTRSCSTSSKD